NELEEALLDVNREYTFAKSRGDEAYYFWKKSIHEGKEEPGYKAKLDENQAEMAKANVKIDRLTAQHDSLANIVAGYTNAAKALIAKRKDLYTSVDLAKSKIE